MIRIMTAWDAWRATAREFLDAFSEPVDPAVQDLTDLCWLALWALGAALIVIAMVVPA